MRHGKIFFFVCFSFTAFTAWCNPITVSGNISRLRFITSVNSVQFISEYDTVIENFDHSNPSHHAMEVLTLSGPEWFEKHVIIIMGDKITALRSVLTGREAQMSIPWEDNVLHKRHQSIFAVVENLPKLRKDIESEAEWLRQHIVERTSGQYAHVRITYSVRELRTFGDITYLAIGFSDDYRSYGGILYILDGGGNIIGKMMLAEDMFIADVSFVRMLSEDRMLLIRTLDAHSPTEISIVSIPVEQLQEDSVNNGNY